jgi:hypothetical protein
MPATVPSRDDFPVSLEMQEVANAKINTVGNNKFFFISFYY